MLHEQILFNGRRCALYLQRLVLDKDVSSVALYAGSHHFRPCLDNAMLVVRSLYAVEPHELAYDIAYLFSKNQVL